MNFSLAHSVNLFLRRGLDSFEIMRFMMNCKGDFAGTILNTQKGEKL